MRALAEAVLRARDCVLRESLKTIIFKDITETGYDPDLGAMGTTVVSKTVKGRARLFSVEERKRDSNINESDLRIEVRKQTMTLIPNVDDKLEVDSETYQIYKVGEDQFAVTWLLRARKL